MEVPEKPKEEEKKKESIFASFSFGSSASSGSGNAGFNFSVPTKDSKPDGSPAVSSKVLFVLSFHIFGSCLHFVIA